MSRSFSYCDGCSQLFTEDTLNKQGYCYWCERRYEYINGIGKRASENKSKYANTRKKEVESGRKVWSRERKITRTTRTRR